VTVFPGYETDKEWRDNPSKGGTYKKVVDIRISCAGDTPEVCSKKLADAAIPGVMPGVSRFIKEFGY
jgi:hypothetical protein